MTTDTVLAILGFALTAGGMVAALWPGERNLMRVTAIVVALVTLLVMGAIVAKGWYVRREAIKEAQLEIMAEVQNGGMTEEDIFQAVNSHRPPGHAQAENLLFDALYNLVDMGVLHVDTSAWQDVHTIAHSTHLYRR